MSFSTRISPSTDAQKKVDKLVNFMLQVQYDYTAIIADSPKEDPTQIGVRKWVKRMIKTIQSDVQTLLKIQQDWDGSVEFKDLDAPQIVEFDSVLEVLMEVLQKEKKINKKLVEFHSKLVRSDEETTAAEEDVIEMVQWRDLVIQQIVQHIIHLEQNQGTVGEFTVNRMMQEEHFRLKQKDLEEQQIKQQQQSLLPTTPEQQRKQQLKQQLSNSSIFSKRTILSARRQQPRVLTPRAEQLLRMKKF